MIVLLDNHDSFTWNVYQALAVIDPSVRVVRNDEISVGALLELHPRAVVLSPGPGEPRDAGIMPEFLALAPAPLPILGVCLGHQALVECYGGALERDPVPMHGRSSLVHHDGDALFDGLSNPFAAARYHSLRARRDAMPRALKTIAWTTDGHVMAVKHRLLPRFGVQFHPESILSPGLERIFAQFLEVPHDRVAT
ncbi:MAG: aminodeoxychorismate/anthranilate synthase component II [Planctomycetota bacterium]|nr:aminodeoxychorismate/anthranilate synthase component II [Planctomycetota bacterium]